MKRLALLLLLLPALASADERILAFHSDIQVYPDASIEVTETIRVRAEGQQIRRGIYRDIPLEYEDRFGNAYAVDIEPLAVLRNGQPEPHHSVRNRDDLRVYFGSSDRRITPGEHTYVYRYRARRMLGFFAAHDELYWNVTGNRWLFPIDVATASVELRFDAPVDDIDVDGYTGRFGSRAQNFVSRRDADGVVHFAASAPLPPAHGLTVVLGWPKGHVVEPTSLQRLGWLLSDNRNLLVALTGFLLLLAWYIPVWKRYGRDPEEGVVVTRYEPPQGFSPASLRYIRQMYYDDKVMTAAIVNLAVKGYLEIENDDDEHVLTKTDPAGATAALAPGERELYEALFAQGDRIELDNANHEILGEARSAHRDSLSQDYQQHYFRTNGLLNIPAVLIVVATLVLAVKIGHGATPMVIGMIVLMFVTLVFFALIMRRPTLRGRALLDEMLGFADYLEVAEKDEMNLRHPPEKTPQLFEAYLPFALALGVEQAWAEKFTAVLAAIRGPDGGSYQPTWYHGTWNTSNLGRTASSLSSGLHSAVSSSVHAPGSSSGGGGGGFSGGGGGGGGGGGW